MIEMDKMVGSSFGEYAGMFYADISSLYPSMMISMSLAPRVELKFDDMMDVMNDTVINERDIVRRLSIHDQ